MKNPYLQIDACVDRLYREYKLHPKLIIAADFDSTIAPFHDYEKDYDYSDTIDVLKRCQEKGFYICIFTGSPVDKYPSILQYCNSLGLEIATINKNPIPLPFGNDGKMYFNVLIDDRAGIGQTLEILNTLLNRIDKKEIWEIAERK
jgi:hypothetical protein